MNGCFKNTQLSHWKVTFGSCVKHVFDKWPLNNVNFLFVTVTMTTEVVITCFWDLEQWTHWTWLSCFCSSNFTKLRWLHDRCLWLFPWQRRPSVPVTYYGAKNKFLCSLDTWGLLDIRRVWIWFLTCFDGNHRYTPCFIFLEFLGVICSIKTKMFISQMCGKMSGKMSGFNHFLLSCCVLGTTLLSS